jgi:serine/threonine protein kinase
MKLIKHDLFYYKSKEEKFHTGMHHLTNNIALVKNKPQKYKLITLYSFSLVNQGDKHTFYFDKEEQYNEWYKHFQKAITYRNIEDFYVFGETLKSDQTKIIRDIYLKKEIIDYHHLNNNSYGGNTKKNDKIKFLLCTQMIKPSNNLIRQHNESIFNEISAFQVGYHQNLCKLYDIFQDEKYLYIITEKCTGDNILQFMRTLDIHNPYKEEEKICEIIHQLLMVIYYLHNFGIIHRNIKPDSILMFRRGFNSYIKLIDLSIVKFLNNNEKTKEPYGSVGYSAPEMLLDLPYDSKIDEWSIGILTYLLLCGKLPFSDEHSEREVARQTIHEKLSFTQPIWEKKSKESKDFVNKLLNKDPKKRMTVKEALTHKWIRKYFPQIVEERLKKQYNYDNEEPIIEFEKYSSNFIITFVHDFYFYKNMRILKVINKSLIKR